MDISDKNEWKKQVSNIMDSESFLNEYRSFLSDLYSILKENKIYIPKIDPNYDL